MKKIAGSIVLLSLCSSLYAQTTNIDALVLYSEGANKLYSGDIQTKLDHLMQVTNDIYKDSGLDIKINFVKKEQIEGVDGYTSKEILKVFQGSKEIKQMRDKAGADEVIIYRPAVGDGYCGLAFQNNILSDKDNYKQAKDTTFAHVSIDCGGYVTAHEVGHNLGLGHSHRQKSSGAFSYAVGHGEDQEFVTIMAYTNAYDAEKVYKFSSPSLKCKGLPCGIAEGLEGEADAVKALAQTAPRLASFATHVDTDDDSAKKQEQKKSELQQAEERYEKALSELRKSFKKLDTLYDNMMAKYNTFLKNGKLFDKKTKDYRAGKITWSKYYSWYKNVYYKSYQDFKGVYGTFSNYVKVYRSIVKEYYAALDNLNNAKGK